MDDQALNPGELIQRAAENGFALAGVCGVERSRWGSELIAWLNESKHGEMGWLNEHTDLRINPSDLIEHAQSVLMVADLYASRSDNTDTPLDEGQGRIARYARGQDYHKIMKKRLFELADELRGRHPDAGFKVFVDTAPVLERELALRAGMGWIGKHTLMIHPREGSYFLLGGIMTTLKLDDSQLQTIEPDHCGTCTRCIDACPTQAITPYSVDARKCISYLTIEHRSEIDPELAAKVGDWIYGCDICQEVCPHNSLREDAAQINHSYASDRDRFDLLEVLGWSEDDRREAFKGSAMKRAKLDMMKRNARIVARNQGIRIPDLENTDSES
ncbi:MAG: tRNA epoxyqueuosine(34) reductase QueG [Phycisphaerales bacterium]